MGANRGLVLPFHPEIITQLVSDPLCEGGAFYHQTRDISLKREEKAVFKSLTKKKTQNKTFAEALPLASWTPVSAPTAAAVSPDKTICPPPWRVASASVATAWAAASLRACRGESRVRNTKGANHSILTRKHTPREGSRAEGFTSGLDEVMQSRKCMLEEEWMGRSCFHWIFFSSQVS